MVSYNSTFFTVDLITYFERTMLSHFCILMTIRKNKMMFKNINIEIKKKKHRVLKYFIQIFFT